VLRHPSNEEIQVYETVKYTTQMPVRVAGLKENVFYKTLAACAVNCCLYVCDGHTVYKVDLLTNNVISLISGVKGNPFGLSVNDKGHVIVTCALSNDILEYTTHGALVRTVELPNPDIQLPTYAAQTISGQLIIIHQRPWYGVSSIDVHGKVTATYRNTKLQKLLNIPAHLLVNKNGSILLADSQNDRVLLLNSSLSSASEFISSDNGTLVAPNRLYFDESRGLLYIGEEFSSRVLIFDVSPWLL